MVLSYVKLCIFPTSSGAFLFLTLACRLHLGHPDSPMTDKGDENDCEVNSHKIGSCKTTKYQLRPSLVKLTSDESYLVSFRAGKDY